MMLIYTIYQGKGDRGREEGEEQSKDTFSIADARVSCKASSLRISSNCCSGGKREVINFLHREGLMCLWESILLFYSSSPSLYKERILAQKSKLG
jgi:hypothetical protein